MAPYVALYRKYRPATFAELVGQEPIARTLASALTQGKLGHAYLFCGPRGTGKTTVARILAKSVNCKHGPTAEPCGTCSPCREITNGTNLDVIEIDAASNNGVDNIRDLQDRVALAPVGGRSKVYIIDEVHMLSQGAFNALLKTLEEPPPNVLFVLATTDPHKVLPTIVSRCQRFDFGRIALAPLIGRLAFVAGEEGIPAETGALEAIARRANGGLRDALSLLDQLAAAMAGAPLTADAVAHGLGLVAGDQVVALADGLVRGDAPAALAVATGLLAAGHDHGTIVRELLAHFRHLMVLQVAPDRAADLDVPIAHQAALRAQAAALPPGEVHWALEALNEAEGTIRRAPQQGIWLELALIKVAARPSIPSLVELAERVARLEAALAGGVTAVVPVAPPVPPPSALPGTSPHQGGRGSTHGAESFSPPPRGGEVPARAEVGDPPPPPPLPPPPPPPTDHDLPPRPPLEVLDGGVPSPPRPAPTPTASPTSAPPAAGGARPVPPGAWDRVHEHVRVKSLPTAALLSQQAAIERWEADGAVVIRMGKTFKEQFDRQAAKKKLLAEAVAAVFGEGAFPRIEVGDGKAAAKPKPGGPAPASAPPMAPPAMPAPPMAPPPMAPPAMAPPPPRPAAPPASDDEPPPPEEPPAWLDDMEASRPPDVRPDERSAIAAPPRPAAPNGGPPPRQAPANGAPPAHDPAGRAAPGTAGVDDPALKLAVELFNGKVVTPAEGA